MESSGHRRLSMELQHIEGIMKREDKANNTELVVKGIS